MAKSETIVREISRIVYQKDKFVIAATTEMDSVLGELIGSEPLTVGFEYKFTGTFSDSKYGKQLKWKSYALNRIVTRNGIVAMLTRTCKGIGPQSAHRIYDVFGKDSITKLRDEPAKASELVQRLPMKVALEASKQLIERGDEVELDTQLAELFGGRGFQQQAYNEVKELWGVSAPSRIRKNPYILLQAQITSCGFARVDNLYLELGLDEDALRRQIFALEHIIRTEHRGSTWMRRDDAHRNLRESISRARYAKAEKGGRRLGLLVTDGEYITLRNRRDKEEELANIVKRMLETPSRWPTEVPGISEHQAERLAIATSKTIGIFEGHGGTGKTYTLARLVSELKGQVLCIAPTGKAAVRLTENLKEQGIEIEAMTTHRALGYLGYSGYEQKFQFNSTNLLDVDWVLADEQSMLSLEMGHALFSALPVGCHVLLTGDDGQLTPIDHGAVFRDLKKCIPVGRLEHVHRYSGNVAEQAQRLREGKAIDAPGDLALDKGRNLMFKQCSSQIKIKSAITKMVRTFPNDKVWDLQFICAVKKGDVGTEAINKIVQSVINATSENVNGVNFRVNDKILNGKNTKYAIAKTDWQLTHASNEALKITRSKSNPDPLYEVDDDDNPVEMVFVANGEQGQTLLVTPDVAVVEFKFPDRITVISRSEFGNIDLAYAITAHKSQGSQWPVVVPIVDSSRRARMVGSKQLWYTAVTRMQTACVVVGDLKSMQQDCRVDEVSKRITKLQELIAYAKEQEKATGKAEADDG